MFSSSILCFCWDLWEWDRIMHPSLISFANGTLHTSTTNKRLMFCLLQSFCCILGFQKTLNHYHFRQGWGKQSLCSKPFFVLKLPIQYVNLFEFIQKHVYSHKLIQFWVNTNNSTESFKAVIVILKLKIALTEIRNPGNSFKHKKPCIIPIMVESIKYLNNRVLKLWIEAENEIQTTREW